MRFDGHHGAAGGFPANGGEKAAYRLFKLARTGLRPARVRDAVEYRKAFRTAANHAFYAAHKSHFSKEVVLRHANCRPVSADFWIS